MRKTILLGLMLAATAVCRAVPSPATLFVYGFSFCFNDSTVYLTDIMQLDSAWIDKKTKFLYSRSTYSYQLRNYLLEQGVENPTCVIMFYEKRKQAEKNIVKLKNRYTKRGVTYIIKYVPASDFQFEAVSAADELAEANRATKEEQKEAKKAEKEARAKQKEMQRGPGGRPPRGGQGGAPQGPPPGDMGGGMR
ncbi:MAG: hypothetical protein LUC26_02565 [Prevotella sp.]|nr:hypothetical protein [Prevotella sp.]